MAGQEDWITKAEGITLFTDNGASADAGKMLEISPTNRIIADREQAIILMVVRLIAVKYENLYPENTVKNKSWKWVNKLADMVEAYQLTVEGKSREQFMNVAILQVKANPVMKELENLVNK